MKPKIYFIISIIFMASFASCLNTTKQASNCTGSVSIVSDSMYISQLDRYRRIWIYLPPNYGKTNKKYPVLYMHDGQNLFDKETSYAGEWCVDETLDSLYKDSKFELIVVGIDNGSTKRYNEYSPWENKKHGKGEGVEYVSFIVNDLKPYIDNNFKTLSDVENTGVMGSSMGGLISHYAVLKYPHVFSKAGILSPSYWYSEKSFSFTSEVKIPKTTKIYLSMGEKEFSNGTYSNVMIDDFNKMYDLLMNKRFPKNNIIKHFIKNGTHSEKTWQAEFVITSQWLFDKN